MLGGIHNNVNLQAGVGRTFLSAAFEVGFDF